jgi:hypothetical protein
MNRYFIKYFSFIIALIFAFNVNAATLPIVKARLDSVNLQMGRFTTLELTVDQPENLKGSFPIFSHLDQSGVIPVCNDSVELRMPVAIDTVRDNGSLRISLKVPVQAFDSGFYHLPEFIYVAGKDTVRSNSVALKVIPVNASKDDKIDEYASLADPENPSILDYIPDFIYDYWWSLILVIILIAAIIYLLRRYREQGHILPKKPEPSPYEVATKNLALLKEKKLWEQGMEKEYYTELTEILRVYLQGRFGINAMEMTSRQILAALSKNPEIKDKRHYVRPILDMADFVKFAKVNPLPDDNVISYENACKFVEETKPLPVEQDEVATEADKKKKPLNKKSVAKKGGAK